MLWVCRPTQLVTSRVVAIRRRFFTVRPVGRSVDRQSSWSSALPLYDTHKTHAERESAREKDAPFLFTAKCVNKRVFVHTVFTVVI